MDRIEAADFRKVMGSYPTGVCAITATGANGAPIGMVVGTFTSVSLDPPLVHLAADRTGRPFLRQRAGVRPAGCLPPAGRARTGQVLRP